MFSISRFIQARERTYQPDRSTRFRQATDFDREMFAIARIVNLPTNRIRFWLVMLWRLIRRSVAVAFGCLLACKCGKGAIAPHPLLF